MDLFETAIAEKTRELVEQLRALPEDTRIDALNCVRKALHEVSPMREEPVDCVLWVPSENVRANDYNPNHVAPPEMRLLRISIESDGYTQPIVVHEEKDEQRLVVIDGFHRNRVGREVPSIRKRVRGRLPVTVINPDRAGENDRVAATIRHNRARGVHGVLPMASIVAGLIKKGWTDDEVARELGMDADEVLRFKQSTGLPELFADGDYSEAWE